MEITPLRVLWGVFSNGEWTGKRAYCTRPHTLSTLHYGLPFSSASSLSGGRNLPLRRFGGTTPSMASGFSVGSAPKQTPLGVRVTRPHHQVTFRPFLAPCRPD